MGLRLHQGVIASSPGYEVLRIEGPSSVGEAPGRPLQPPSTLWHLMCACFILRKLQMLISRSFLPCWPAL